MTLAVPPACVVIAMTPPARHTKSAACAPTTMIRSLTTDPPSRPGVRRSATHSQAKTQSSPSCGHLDAGHTAGVRHCHGSHLILAEAGLEHAVRHERQPVLDRRVRLLPEVR